MADIDKTARAIRRNADVSEVLEDAVDVSADFDASKRAQPLPDPTLDGEFGAAMLEAGHVNGLLLVGRDASAADIAMTKAHLDNAIAQLETFRSAVNLSL